MTQGCRTSHATKRCILGKAAHVHACFMTSICVVLAWSRMHWGRDLLVATAVCLIIDLGPPIRDWGLCFFLQAKRLDFIFFSFPDLCDICCSWKNYLRAHMVIEFILKMYFLELFYWRHIFIINVLVCIMVNVLVVTENKHTYVLKLSHF